MTSEPIKFLLVDDKTENLFALEAIIRREGLEVLLARSGSDALELLLVHDVSLALLDVQMPVMDGFELAELMRGVERTKRVPIIFVTAGTRDPQRVFKGYESGAVDFLFKPIDPHILKSKADVFFELARQRREVSQTLRLNEMFVGILGHDLRNPLAAMIMGTAWLQRQIADEAQMHTLRQMMVAGHRMTEMIEQLLDLTRARLAGGLGLSLVRKHLDVGELVERAVDELRATNPDREIVIESDGDCTTWGDPDRLLQLFSNFGRQCTPPRDARGPHLVKHRRRRTRDRDPDLQWRCHPARAVAGDLRTVPWPNQQLIATRRSRSRAFHLPADRDGTRRRHRSRIGLHERDGRLHRAPAAPARSRRANEYSRVTQ